LLEGGIEDGKPGIVTNKNKH